MRAIVRGREILAVLFLVCSFAAPQRIAHAQEPRGDGSGAPQLPANNADRATVTLLLQELQAQIQGLRSEVKDLKAEQVATRAEAAQLHNQLDQVQSQLSVLTASLDKTTPAAIIESAPSQGPSVGERLQTLEEDQRLTDARIAEQNQTKVESASKYRVRLSGIVLLNMFINRGTVDNADFPQIAIPRGSLSSDASFGGSLRQSQISFQAFGPAIAGARTRADIQLDLAGGFPQTPNGTSFGLMRLRTGTVRFDWKDTSLIAGQDALFIAPASPTSLATLAVPALSYSGNLWGWTPQVRVEHRLKVSESSTLSLQGGILDSLSGETPFSEYNRSPVAGEMSGQPAYATRVSWAQQVHGQDLIFGAGAYYGRQTWGFRRAIDSWAGTLDLTVPLGSLFEFSGQYYRGRAVGGLSGGIGQSVLWNGSLANPATDVYGLNSLGGWAQLKLKATRKLQFNGAFGQDNPFASELRQFGGNEIRYGAPLSKNQSEFVNFIYQPRSDVVFSTEYRRLRTFLLDSKTNAANIVNFSVGYIF
ncbi:MAG TPA: hypothetical protein VF758_08480 [Candidatus Acidoferrum sp.]